MKALSHLWLWQFGSYLRYGMLSSCICSTLVSMCAMKGIPIGPLAQWGKDLTYCLTPFFCLVTWDMHYPGSACRGKDLPSGRLLYIHACKFKNVLCALGLEVKHSKLFSGSFRTCVITLNMDFTIHKLFWLQYFLKNEKDLIFKDLNKIHFSINNRLICGPLK